ncbi:MAG: cytochrome c maturation protein CcmE [Raoultibacter sp.]
MNTKTKRRLVVVSGVIIVVVILALAFIGGRSAAKTVSVAEAVEQDYTDQKIQVSGNVVSNSFETKEDILYFSIYDPEGDPTKQLNVMFDGGVTATFGNEVTAICTGRVDSDGVLHASELVTKCPSKYENATNALEIGRLLEYGEEVYDKPVKVTGLVKTETLKPAGQGERFVLIDTEGTNEIPVEFEEALSEEITDGSSLVITGSLTSDQRFIATEVALEG